MRRYETIVIFDPYQSTEVFEKHISKIEQLIKSHDGSVFETENWGKRHLAYEIKKKQQGIYVQFNFEADSTVLVKELEREFRLNESVLRYLTLKFDKKKLAFKKESIALDSSDSSDSQQTSSEEKPVEKPEVDDSSKENSNKDDE